MAETATVTPETPVVAQTQETAPVVKSGKVNKTGNPLLDTAAVTETITKTKALHRADQLVEDIDRNSFELGGVLLKIQEQGWWDGYESFGAFCFERYGFQERKARYLMAIYTNLITKNIPWEKVKDLGWTKLKDLAAYLTPENVDVWVEKVKDLSYVEMMKLLKGSVEDGQDESTKTTSDSQTLKFKGLKADQVATIQTALSKAKAELPTEYDNVALESIAAAYCGGTVSVASTPTLKDLMKDAGWEAAIGVYGELFGDVVDVKVTELPKKTA